jgi:hypothetical protein
MAGPAPTTLSNHEDRSAGPVHSSGWLSRMPGSRALRAQTIIIKRQFGEVSSQIVRRDADPQFLRKLGLVTKMSAAEAAVHPLPQLRIHLQIGCSVRSVHAG